MDSLSNTTSFATLTGTYPATKLASGLSINTDTLICTGDSHASIVMDVLFRSKETVTRNFDIIICATGSNSTVENNRVQIQLPASAGNNGSVSLASLAGLAPLLFDLDLAGNRAIILESGVSIYVRNLAALTADIYVTVKKEVSKNDLRNYISNPYFYVQEV
ncbi:hypothetical protein HK413_04600 [Mucilaginibacter sp. S1162]|uniref:Uncharacterized protein n=1 Tax=Mucilaginibacter humi TaxID=2732510 RepID=A0ABX1W064_9SPHI|nr:hypothetical protein [Mucilaginibacter humi]NNU33609.1 hypothetical protein [Mucilaginibacter humi]